MYVALTWIHLAARRERVSLVAAGTATSGHMIPHLTVGIVAAGAGTRIDALAVAAHLRVAALVMVEASAAMAVGERIALVTGRARADGATANRFLAPGGRTARIPGTSLTWTQREIWRDTHTGNQQWLS